MLKVTQQRIGVALGVSQSTIRDALAGLVVTTKPARPKGGRPKAAPKPRPAKKRSDKLERTVAKKPLTEARPQPLTEDEAIAFLRSRGYQTISREKIAVSAPKSTTCPNCGKTLRPDQTYCSGRCRVAAFRKRQRTTS
jgi:hypothetical protein